MPSTGFSYHMDNDSLRREGLILKAAASQSLLRLSRLRSAPTGASAMANQFREVGSPAGAAAELLQHVYERARLDDR